MNNSPIIVDIIDKPQPPVVDLVEEVDLLAKFQDFKVLPDQRAGMLIRRPRQSSRSRRRASQDQAGIFRAVGKRGNTVTLPPASPKGRAAISEKQKQRQNLIQRCLRGGLGYRRQAGADLALSEMR